MKLRRQRAVGWAYGLTWGSGGLQAVTTLTLAATLGPEEFGVMALAMIYINLIEIILQQGFAAAIIQRKVLRQEQVSSVFWLLVAGSMLLAVSAVGFSGYWARFSRSPQLETVIPVLSLALPILAVRMVPTALLTRHLQFKALTVRSLVAASISSALGITMALLGWGLWSLVAQHLVNSLVATVFIWRTARWRPRFSFSWSAARELLPFSLANFAARAGTVVSMQVDAIVIGAFWGPAAVGLYRLAARCVAMVLEFLSGPLQSVSFPELSKLQDDPDQFQAAFLRYVRHASLITWPALAALAALSPYIPATLGEQWRGVEPAIVALALCGAIQTITQFLGPLLQSLGKPGLLARIVWAQAILGAVIFAIIGNFSSDQTLGVQAGTIAFSKAVLFLALPLPAIVYLSKTVLHLPAARLGRVLLPAAVTANCVYLLGVLAAQLAGRVFGWQDWVQVVWLVSVLSLSAVAMALLLDRDLRRRVFVVAAATDGVPRFLALFRRR